MRMAQCLLLICALYFPTIPDALPANDHARSPTVCQSPLRVAMTTALLMHVSRPQREFPSRVGIIIALASLAVWGACSHSSARILISLRSAFTRERD
jgi:hypothetical protein